MSAQIMRFPTERTSRGKVEAAWNVYQSALSDWYAHPRSTEVSEGMPLVEMNGQFIAERNRLLDIK